MRDESNKPGPGVTVTAYPDGPLILRGEFTVVDDRGERVDTGRMAALCRCGRSAQKPLCDGSHRNARRARRASDD